MRDHGSLKSVQYCCRSVSFTINIWNDRLVGIVRFLHYLLSFIIMVRGNPLDAILPTTVVVSLLYCTMSCILDLGKRKNLVL